MDDNIATPVEGMVASFKSSERSLAEELFLLFLSRTENSLGDEDFTYFAKQTATAVQALKTALKDAGLEDE